jgi:LEA14-like dessication related protein
MKRFIPFLLLIPALFSACSLFQTPKFEGVNEFQLKELTPDHTNVDLSIVISNPNNYSITLKSLNIEVMDCSRDRLGTVTMSKPLLMHKNSADTVYFQIQLDTRKVTKLACHSSRNVEFLVRAEAVAKVFGVTKKVTKELPNQINLTQILEEMLPKVPTDYTIPTINTDSLKKSKKNLVVTDPKIANGSHSQADMFKIIKTSVTDIGLKETELTVKFILLNPYGVSFVLRDFPADIWINDKFAGKGRLDSPIIFDENIYSADGELKFELNNFNSLKLAANALVKKDMNYRVEGTLLVDAFDTHITKPFRFKGIVEIGKKDK